MTRFWKVMQRFARNSDGNAGMIFGLAVVPLLAASGAGLDFGRYHLAKTHLQAALDAAALAAAAPGIKTDAERITAGDKLFAANIEHGVEADLVFDGHVNVKNGMAVATGDVTVDMHFISFAGPKEIQSSDASYDVALQEELFVESARLTGLGVPTAPRPC